MLFLDWNSMASAAHLPNVLSTVAYVIRTVECSILISSLAGEANGKWRHNMPEMGLKSVVSFSQNAFDYAFFCFWVFAFASHNSLHYCLWVEGNFNSSFVSLFFFSDVVLSCMVCSWSALKICDFDFDLVRDGSQYTRIDSDDLWRVVHGFSFLYSVWDAFLTEYWLLILKRFYGMRTPCGLLAMKSKSHNNGN